MSSGVNRVILIGHLGADPEKKSTATGRQVAEFRMATSRRWTDANGEVKESTDWHRVKVWGRMADPVCRFLAKGRQVYVEGRIETRKWVDKEGHDRYITEIVAQQVVFLGGGRQEGGQRGFEETASRELARYASVEAEPGRYGEGGHEGPERHRSGPPAGYGGFAGHSPRPSHEGGPDREPGADDDRHHAAAMGEAWS